MSVMFRNSNADVEKELAVEDYKAHPVRNRMAILAVTLTTILICVVFTVGFGFTTALSLSFGASPGPGADSCSIYGDEEVLERTRTLSQVDHAVIDHIKSHIRIVDKIVGKILLYLVLLVSRQNNKLVKTKRRIIFHDMPKYGLFTDLDHRFGF